MKIIVKFIIPSGEISATKGITVYEKVISYIGPFDTSETATKYLEKQGYRYMSNERAWRHEHSDIRCGWAAIEDLQTPDQ